MGIVPLGAEKASRKELNSWKSAAEQWKKSAKGTVRSEQCRSAIISPLVETYSFEMAELQNKISKKELPLIRQFLFDIMRLVRLFLRFQKKRL